PFPVQWFSRPPPSTTPPSLRANCLAKSSTLRRTFAHSRVSGRVNPGGFALSAGLGIGTRCAEWHSRSVGPYGTMALSMGAIGLSERRYGAERQDAMLGSIQTLRVDKGFGFIKDDAGKEYFFHRSAVFGEGLENLREGDSVEFDIGEGPKGPRAENVRRTST